MLLEKDLVIEVENAIDDLPEGLNEASPRILHRSQSSLSSYLQERAFKVLH